MRALRFALVAALVSVSVVESSAVFARGAAGGGGGAGAGASGGTGGAGAPLRTFSVVNNTDQVRPDPYHHRQISPAWTFSSCFKQDELYDRHGYAVVNQHGAECFGQ